jgi:mRNA interferase RelE/StbE
MAWRIELSPLAEKNLAQLDRKQAQRILKLLFERVSKLDDARSIGEALKGSKPGEFWKCRVGDYRVIASIEDHHLTVIVVRISDRKDVYKR